MINLKDKLSHLSFIQACKLLGPQGKDHLIQGGMWDVDLEEQVILKRDLFYLDLGEAGVTLRLDPAKNHKIDISCSVCPVYCDHQGAALSLILEEKLSLGLAAPPKERVPIESLSDEELVALAIDERAERAKNEKMRLTSMNRNILWTDYMLINAQSGKSYRIALRGWERGESFCSCPDFRKNTLGTCKHIIYALGRVKQRFSKKVRQTPYKVKDIGVYLKYEKDLNLHMQIPEGLDTSIAKLVRPFKEKPISNIKALLKKIRRIENHGSRVTIYPDAEAHISERLYRERVKAKVGAIRKDPKNHRLRTTLLKAELHPYQLDGIAFAVGAGRAILADDMGLGKTIQGIGVAELLSRDADISKVLVICPASLKAQWRIEIMRFVDRSCQMILGSAKDRALQYDNECFYTICNYEQVLRDIMAIEKVKWDLIIIDEAQRIKNWEAKTSRTIKALRSPFALALSGTPLENRLEELFSVVEFIDDRRLGAAFRFHNQHRVVDERGKLLGYKNLHEVREKLKPVLLRRTRKSVLKQLPPRTTEIMRIPPTDEQLKLHNSHKQIVSTIINKKFLTEMDILRLQKALLMCRMSADSTFLVDKQPPGYSSKLEELALIMEQLLREDDRKILLFSEWTTMLNLIEPLLTERQVNYVRLDGSVPQKKRQGLVHQFQKDPECKLFVTTNAGATGLNLQAANTVINVDLPWNPAILEQRIGRAHRMGQKRPVQVFVLVTEDTLEESLLNTLAAKHALSLAVLDLESTASEVDLTSGIDELKLRLEILIGKKPDAAVDESRKAQVEKEAALLARKEKVALAGGQMISAAFAFLGELFPQGDASPETLKSANAFKQKLSEGLERSEDGKLNMTVTFPDESALDDLAGALARMIGSSQNSNL
ncbi:MAG: DEAD/DEAH box helicase [Deltaproteobacteria bacterium]|nr:DEAD/DEAH box helicase [Deltaproteobacteria bacterium]MBW2676116.1 DEAD/DEAH box helicase [Deltaproteobacteria bacterium]